MKTRQKFLRTATRAAAPLLIIALTAGCQTTTAVIDPNSGQRLTTVGQINFQDYNQASMQLVENLLTSGRLDRMDNRPSIIMLSRIANKTSQHVDTELLTQNIRVALSRSGKAAFTTALAAGGAEDEASYQVRELRASDEFNQGTIAAKGSMIAPDYSLSGRIIQQTTYQGNKSQAAYTFQLTLTDLATGIAIWEDQQQIVKQGTQSKFGL